MPVRSGLEMFLEEGLELAGGRVGLVVNPASVDSRLRHAADLFFEHPDIELTTLMGPQHGARGETQDNMIEWRDYRDAKTGLPVFSLYGETRKPTREMLERIDVLFFDLQDVGARIYTFIYTMALAMQACAEAGKSFVVLDRPNPIAGTRVEGPVLDPAFTSFVGLFPLAVRHGMTVGELAGYFNAEFGLGCDLHVVAMKGWRREMYFDDTGLPWVLPSPNLPTLESALLYPGLVFLEGTNASEGRGTTRPFELSGAPWIEPDELVSRLKASNLKGAHFRPAHFIPTSGKWKDQLVGGLQVHVLDRLSFEPVRTGLAILMALRELGGDRFQWARPPYEYEQEKLPIDVLFGTDRVRLQMESGCSPAEIEQSWSEGLEAFRRIRHNYLLY